MAARAPEAFRVIYFVIALILKFKDLNFILEFMMFLSTMAQWAYSHAAFLQHFLQKIRSVRKLDTIFCSGTSLWLVSPAWDAIKLTPEIASWLHLSFRGH